MLHYPMLIPARTDYSRLGVDPEATAQEVNEAKAEYINKLEGRLREVGKRLASVFEAVPGLKDAYSDYESLEARDADTSNRTDLVRELRRLEERATAIEPEFQRLRKREAELNKELEEVNVMDLLNPTKRESYDGHHPPLRLLELENATRDRFATDRKLFPGLLRRSLARHFEKRGEPVFHPSDQTRRDFTADFSHTPLLDGN